MDGFSPNLMKLWKKWNVRVTVLLSFMLQIVLIVLSKRRKYDSRLWIRIVTWCAYLSADLIATYALGIITNNMSRFHETNCGSMCANTELTAFWAPFLLTHLGGPDTITAYSLEDNELWLRHLLGLLVQMVMAIYVSVMAWTGSLLSYLSLLMLFAGLIKYGERTWVLRKASVEEIRDSFEHLNRSQVQSIANYFRQSDHYELLAYYLMQLCFQPLFLDLNQSSSFVFDLFKDSSEPPEENIFLLLLASAENTFQVIEMSLAIMYDNLYTKALLLYTHVGLGLRVITVLLTSSVSVLFSVLIHKHKFPKIDVTITFILLYGAITLEIYSALLLLFSDRFQVWLIQHPNCLKMFGAFEGVVEKKKRWSNKMSQLSLLSFIMKEKPMPCSNFLKHFSIVQKLENQLYTADVKVPNYLKTLIFRYLEAKKAQDQTTPSDSLSIDLDGVDFTKELEKSILTWHVATEIWYEMDQKNMKGKRRDIELHCESIYQISRYMFFLLVLHPNMISNANTTKFTLQPILVAARRSSFSSRDAACRNLNDLLHSAVSEIEEFSKNLAGVDESIFDLYKTVLPTILGRLKGKHWQERWMIISCTWLEMLAYAASKCRGMQHARRLKCGGEFFTHVWLLTKYLDFNEKDFTSHGLRWPRSIIDLSEATSRRVEAISDLNDFLNDFSMNL